MHMSALCLVREADAARTAVVFRWRRAGGRDADPSLGSRMSRVPPGSPDSVPGKAVHARGATEMVGRAHRPPHVAVDVRLVRAARVQDACSRAVKRVCGGGLCVEVRARKVKEG
eukprot:CAMPEP_0185165468 /NCGR_PEP_ID=MMETSP1139-20130426/10936_1 /TAXON_ID=298111 /ORGANISM="Pavlova sp., Strain CCMP459" /LENGTH=113 /DNA_ID=CAMNT_0027730867 /DNA_START=80 /DNA_END=420 /DNA_ORIENTATION=+